MALKFLKVAKDKKLQEDEGITKMLGHGVCRKIFDAVDGLL